MQLQNYKKNIESLRLQQKTLGVSEDLTVFSITQTEDRREVITGGLTFSYSLLPSV